MASSITRRAMLAMSDPVVRYQLAGFDLELPLSHELPYYRVSHPQYGTNIARLARAVARKYPAATVVDIGANVGDTAALIRSMSDAPILCIEGDETFFRFLERNATRIPALHLEKSLVGGVAEHVRGTLSTSRGTGRVVSREDATLRLEPLEDILSRWPFLTPTHLVKIDTDGFDCAIITGAARLWERLRPVLFFEYDPAYLPAGFDPLLFFGQLAGAGYDRLFVYENTGEFVLSLPLGEQRALEDLHHHYSGHANQRYADLVLFHRDDADLAERFRRAEIEHFARVRGLAVPLPNRPHAAEGDPPP